VLTSKSNCYKAQRELNYSNSAVLIQNLDKYNFAISFLRVLHYRTISTTWI